MSVWEVGGEGQVVFLTSDYRQPGDSMAACGGATAEGLAEWKGWMVAGGVRAGD